MFCNSDSWDSANCRSEPRSRPLAMEAVYFLYSSFSLFIQVHGETVWKSEWRGRSMTYATEHEEELRDRSLRCRMVVIGALCSHTQQARTTENSHHPPDPQRHLLRPQERMFLEDAAPRLSALGGASTCGSGDGASTGRGRGCAGRSESACGPDWGGTPTLARARWSRSRSKPRAWEEEHEATRAQRRSKVASATCCSWSVSHRPTLLAVPNNCGKGFSKAGLSPVLRTSGVWGSRKPTNEKAGTQRKQLGTSRGSRAVSLLATLYFLQALLCTVELLCARVSYLLHQFLGALLPSAVEATSSLLAGKFTPCTNPCSCPRSRLPKNTQVAESHIPSLLRRILCRSRGGMYSRPPTPELKRPALAVLMSSVQAQAEGCGPSRASVPIFVLHRSGHKVLMVQERERYSGG